MKRSALIVLAVLAAALGAGGAWWLWSARADTQPAFRTQAAILGSVEDTVTAVGTLQPLNYVDVGTQVSGQLRHIYVDFGEKVAQGQLLAQIDPTVYEARVAADQANLLALRAQRSDKLVQLELAEKQFARQRRLLADRATSQDAFDQAEANRKSLQAQIAVLDAQIQQGEATLKSDQANLSYTKIYAPMAGTVVDILARQGQTLNANQSAPLVLRVANLATMTVRTQVSEADVPKLKLGMEAWFTTLGQPEKKRQGRLRQILPTPEVVNNVVLYPALFDVPNPDGDLLPQMSAQVFFIVSKAENLPVVPMAALRPLRHGKAAPDDKSEANSAGADSRNRYALRVLEDGAPVRRVVEVAASNRVSAAIAAGLKEGEDVVLDQPASTAAARPPRMPRL